MNHNQRISMRYWSLYATSETLLKTDLRPSYIASDTRHVRESHMYKNLLREK